MFQLFPNLESNLIDIDLHNRLNILIELVKKNCLGLQFLEKKNRFSSFVSIDWLGYPNDLPKILTSVFLIFLMGLRHNGSAQCSSNK